MKKVLIVFILTLLVISCSETIYETSTFVDGVIRDSVTGAPIREAWFIMNDTLNTDSYQYSDSTGHYRWVDWGALEGVLYVGKEGYYTRFKDLGRLTKDTTGVDFELPPIR
jgi:hypothetical protein